MTRTFSIHAMRCDKIPSAYESEEANEFHSKLSKIIFLLIAQDTLCKSQEWAEWLSKNSGWQQILCLSGSRSQMLCQFFDLLRLGDFSGVNSLPDMPESREHTSWFPNGYVSIDVSMLDDISDLKEIPGLGSYLNNSTMQLL